MMRDILFRYLPLRISRAVNKLPEDIFCQINEVRLRKNSPISVTAGARNITFDEDGNPCSLHRAIRADEQDIAECLSNLTSGSLYICDEYLRQGFIPLPEGGRAGVCGRMKFQDGKINGFAEIYSINLRLNRIVADFASPLIDYFSERGVCGTLVCSPPAMGKTTFLKSAACLLATGKGIAPKRVCVADERCELSAGLYNHGIMDILSGAPKAEAITMLTRTMAPEIIICDEISPQETEALSEAQNTGVFLIASAHCKNPKELMKRGRMKLLLESGIFPLCVILEYDGGYKCKIAETEEFL